MKRLNMQKPRQNNAALKRDRITTITSSLVALGLIALGLTGCSTATLISANIDLASFVPVNIRSFSVPLLPVLTSQSFKPLDDNDGNPNNGFLIETPISSIDIIEAFNADLALVLSSGNATAVKAELFVAPVGAVDVYQSQYSVALDEKSIAAGGQETLRLRFALQKNSPTSVTLTEIKKGKFRLGLSLGLQAPTGGSFSYNLSSANAGVSGYPAKIVAK
jgi:hypothetical protein